MRKLTKRLRYPYVPLVGDLDKALRLHDLGTNVLVGEIDRPQTNCAASVERAAMVVATGNDFANTNNALRCANYALQNGCALIHPPAK